MKPNQTEEEKALLVQFLLRSTTGTILPKGKIAEAVQRFGMSRSTVYSTWLTIRRRMAENAPVSLTSKMKGVVRKKTVMLDEKKMKQVHFHRRGTIRDLGASLGVSKSTIWRWKKEGVIRAHTNAIKPSLTQANKVGRLKFSLRALKWDLSLGKFVFKSMSHVIHADEKWLCMTKAMERYYMCIGEEEPTRSCQNKKFIPKVMFISLASRPIYTNEGELLFDGKIGMWAFTKREQTRRNSRNREAGIWVTKPLDSINKEVTKNMLINQVIPAIKAKWPATMSKNIIIQWDNAPPHINNSDPDFRQVATADRWDIQLIFQPPNSPDTNINDLGWFRSIDSIKTDIQATTVEQLVDAVNHAYHNLSHETLNKNFISLQLCLIETMKNKGDHNYKIPHMSKDHLQRMGLLPTDLEVDVELVKDCIKYLQDEGQADGLECIISQLEIGGVLL